MPLAPRLLVATAFLLAGGGAGLAARALVAELEDRSAEAVAAELEAAGHLWAEAIPDGLQVVLEGEAPDEAARFQAVSAAGRAVDGARVIDNLRVAPRDTLAAPAFAVEILRNDAGVSLIGLIPEATDRDRLRAEVAEAVPGLPVADLLQTAAYPAPEGWDAALAFAAEALASLPRAKLSVGPGHVAVEAVADSPGGQRRLESLLARARPEAVTMDVAIMAPPPVISPFALRFRLDEGGARFDACAAEGEAARAAILAAARAAGARDADCRLGLGAPSPDWPEAAAQGIAAVAAMGGGTLAMTDADILLVAPPEAAPEAFEQAVEELRATLPRGFAFRAERAEAGPAAAAPAEFRATLSAEGQVRLAGPLADARMTGLAQSLAQARFGAERVTLATRTDPAGLPEGWSLRVLAGIEALAQLAHGSVAVTPDRVAVRGVTGSPTARETIAAALSETLGAGAQVALDVTYDEALDPLAALPSPEECLAEIVKVTADTKITFDPGSASLSSAARPALDQIADILRSCGELRLRIAGYTDSQGREETNLRLSQARAEAVLDALRAARVPVMGFEAVGYGEADPIASNSTEAGREANRRIEFSLIGAPAAAESAAESAGAVYGPPPPPPPEAPPAIVEGRPPAVPPTRPPEDAAP
jgi:OOP family OmpA-OmpF porin